ncbi:MAG: uncharacterized membrane protein YbaN (DUF454 family) [Planctomycetota bacterium]
MQDAESRKIIEVNLPMLCEPKNKPGYQVPKQAADESAADRPDSGDPQLNAEDDCEAQQAPVIVRGFFQLIGWVSVGLAVLGIPLPVLPTTPFLLLAAACFARSSPKLHRRLIEHKRLGPMLSQWNDDRSVTPAVKRRAISMTTLSFAVSIWIIDATWIRVLLVSVGFCVVLFLASFRTSTGGTQTDASDG